MTFQINRQKSWLGTLKGKLIKSSSLLMQPITKLLSGIGNRRLDDETLSLLEDIMISADLGPLLAHDIRQSLARQKYDGDFTTQMLQDLLAAELTAILQPLQRTLVLQHQPHIILVVGVNGVGKTTTIGKVAMRFRKHDVIIAACDTFRAAATEQLVVWGERTGARVMTRPHKSDPAALAYEAVSCAIQSKAGLLLIDTAGRLQNKADLMAELAKINRSLKKHDINAPHDTILVLDATTGQNALDQLDIFNKYANISGIIMTKLDGSAHGGILAAIAKQYKIPIYAIGVGEEVDDLQDFNAADFAKALIGAI